MKKIIAAILALFGAGAQAVPEEPANQSAIDGLRSMALNIKAEDIGLTRENFPNEVFGVLMETGFEKGSFTLLVFADGTTGLYFSNGGGIIGAGAHETVRKASSVFLSAANHYRAQTKPVSSYPHPSAGQVRFYLIGYSGVTGYAAKEEDLGENRDSLSQLFHAAHRVISELRQIEESRHNK